MSLFRRKKLGTGLDVDPDTDEGIIGVYYAILGEVNDDFIGATRKHMEMLHEPGGMERRRAEKDFMELGMARSYIDALDDIEFKVDDAFALPGISIGVRGRAAVVSRWTARGRQTHPFLGIPPTGEQVTIEGMTYTTFRNFNIRSDHTYWQMVELTQKMVGR
jgi:hypothetical protein